MIIGYTKAEMKVNIYLKIGKFLKYGVLFLILAMSYTLVQNIREILSSGGRIQEAESRLSDLDQERLRIEKELEIVNSQLYIEKQARDKLGFGKEGEVVLVLPDKEMLKAFAIRTKDSQEFVLPLPNWKKWLEVFGIEI